MEEEEICALEIPLQPRRAAVSEVGSWRGLGKKRVLVVLGDPYISPAVRKRSARTGETVIEDHQDVEAIAKQALLRLLKDRGAEDSVGLNLEPLEVLADLLRGVVSPHIGGPPQLVKIYPHSNVQPFGVRWPDRKGGVAVLGRVLPRGEKAHVPVIDLVSLEVERPKATSAIEVSYDDAS